MCTPPVHYYIKMEDIAAGMLKPCIADIKIGRQTWDPYSSPEKQFTENVTILHVFNPLIFFMMIFYLDQ